MLLAVLMIDRDPQMGHANPACCRGLMQDASRRNW